MTVAPRRRRKAALQDLTEDGRRIVRDIADRHDVSLAAAETLLAALAAGSGRQAQFDHPELGGMGQWSQGGMIMIGDMFDHGLKHRVARLCEDLAAVLQDGSAFAPATRPRGTSADPRWPEELGSPASTGSQNDLHYAVFPMARRLAVSQGGRMTLYDTADYRITGFSQQQGTEQSLTFTSQHGTVRLADLKRVEPATAEAPTPSPTESHDDIFAKLERLAELRDKGIVTAEEFNAKKAELLSRL